MSKPRLLTPEEWFLIRTIRGRQMTGQNDHRTKLVPINPDQPHHVRGAGKTYYWCMGQQPEKALIHMIARRCPIKAAEAYLDHFRKGNPNQWPQGFVKPVAAAS